jgi:hypothetical protein
VACTVSRPDRTERQASGLCSSPCKYREILLADGPGIFPFSAQFCSIILASETRLLQEHAQWHKNGISCRAACVKQACKGCLVKTCT